MSLALSQPSLTHEFQHHLPEVLAAVQNIVVRSMTALPVLGTGATRECRARTQWCLKMALELRHSMKWGHVRIIDSLPEALTSFIQTGAWEPDKRTMWVPSDGN